MGKIADRKNKRRSVTKDTKVEFLIDYQEKWPNFLQIVFEEI